MKRFVLLAMLAMTWWCVPAFGAESIRILRNGEEVRLSQDVLRQDGTLMMSMQDLAELTESELRQDGNITAFGYRMKDAGWRCGVRLPESENPDCGEGGQE